MLAAFIGASRGVGYHTVVQLLSSPSTQWTAILLVRKPEALSSDPNLAEYISSGRLQLIKGDATVEDDIRQLFDRQVDLLVTSIGKFLHAVPASAEN